MAREEKSGLRFSFSSCPSQASWVALGRDKGEKKHFTRLSADTLVPEVLEWESSVGFSEGSRTPQTLRFMTRKKTQGKWDPGYGERWGCWVGPSSGLSGGTEQVKRHLLDSYRKKKALLFSWLSPCICHTLLCRTWLLPLKSRGTMLGLSYPFILVLSDTSRLFIYTPSRANPTSPPRLTMAPATGQIVTNRITTLSAIKLHHGSGSLLCTSYLMLLTSYDVRSSYSHFCMREPRHRSISCPAHDCTVCRGERQASKPIRLKKPILYACPLAATCMLRLGMFPEPPSKWTW